MSATATAGSSYPSVSNTADNYKYYGHNALPPSVRKRFSPTCSCHCFKTSFLCAMLITMVIVVTYFSIEQAKCPSPILPEYTLRSFSLSRFNIVDEQLLSAKWNASLLVANPNKKLTIEYHQVIAHVIHKHYCLGEAQILPFDQGKLAEQTVEVHLVLLNSYVEQPILNDINGEKVVDGEMKFNLKLFADFDFDCDNYGPISSKKSSLKIWCNNVNISNSSGKMIGGPLHCRVKQYEGPIDGANC